jgi:hypothetical protein
MADEKLTWREALQVMLAGEEVERTFAGGWLRMRMIFGDVPQIQFWTGSGWHEENVSVSTLAACQWRRVPKTPRVHELPAMWRLTYATSHNHIADELEAALREDELVSLKGVTAEELRQAWNNSCSMNFELFILDYLRKRAVKP